VSPHGRRHERPETGSQPSGERKTLRQLDSSHDTVLEAFVGTQSLEFHEFREQMPPSIEIGRATHAIVQVLLDNGTLGRRELTLEERLQALRVYVVVDVVTHSVSTPY
jgi:hypothetical protein